MSCLSKDEQETADLRVLQRHSKLSVSAIVITGYVLHFDEIGNESLLT